jgi:tRNA(His) 5'-end guanylyltransferase
MHDLDHHLKSLEQAAATPALGAGYLYSRLDGRGFSRLTKSVQRPFDPGLHDSMVAAAHRLMVSFQATLAYVQSDEISLVWTPREETDSWIFAGRREKWLSLLASEGTVSLAMALMDRDSDTYAPFLAQHPHFDSRLVDGLSRADALAFLSWRHMDGVRNAVQTLAQHHFPKKSLHHQSLETLRQRLLDHGTPLDSMPPAFRYGTLLHWDRMELTFSAMDHIPPAYRPSPDETVIRRVIQHLPLDPTLRFESFLPSLPNQSPS